MRFYRVTYDAAGWLVAHRVNKTMLPWPWQETTMATAVACCCRRLCCYS